MCQIICVYQPPTPLSLIFLVASWLATPTNACTLYVETSSRGTPGFSELRQVLSASPLLRRLAANNPGATAAVACSGGSLIAIAAGATRRGVAVFNILMVAIDTTDTLHSKGAGGGGVKGAQLVGGKPAGEEQGADGDEGDGEG